MKKPAVLVCVVLLSSYQLHTASTVSAAQAGGPGGSITATSLELNALGYAALRQQDTKAAIAAFSELARIQPQEPRALDSLGEALMAAGRFKDAEAAFQKALTLSSHFWPAHEGIAFARFYAGNVAGAREEWIKARELGTMPANRFRIDADMAAAALAQRNTVEAIRILVGAARAESGDPQRTTATGALLAQILIVSDQPREALKVIADALKAVDSGSPGSMLNQRRNVLRARVAAEALLNDVAAAKKTSAELDLDAASHADEAIAQDAMHFGRGALASASGDWAAARSHFDRCEGGDVWCGWYGVMAAQRAGDKTGAAASREALLKLYLRSSGHMIVRSRLANFEA